MVAGESGHGGFRAHAGAEAAAKAERAELRLAFERLGPAFVKLGQLISVRPDLFGPELVFEMEKLQDSVAPLPATADPRCHRRGVRARTRVALLGLRRQAAGQRVDRAGPPGDTLAGLSAGRRRDACLRVHRSRSRWCDRASREPSSPTSRPRDRLRIRLARLPRLARYNLPGLLDEFAATLCSECDLRTEARVADRFAFDFRDDELMVVPRVVWPLTSRRVLTTEFIEGWRLSELGEASARGVNGRMLAEHGAQVFMRQVLEIGRFHADLHPANLFVTPDSRICYLDFGIIGTTSPEQRVAIAQVLAATVYGDADRALKYSAELGLVVPDELQPIVRRAVGELMTSTLAESPRDVRGFAIGFLRIMDEAHVTVPVGYGLLVKALVTVEGVARALYPDIDITVAAGPFATRLIARWMLHPARIADRMPAALRAAVKELAG